MITHFNSNSYVFLQKYYGTIPNEDTNNTSIRKLGMFYIQGVDL